MKFIFLSAIALLLAVELGLAVCYTSLPMTIVLLLAFFVAFNVLEASLPSLVSRAAEPASRGTALGVYNTAQALGLFVGGAVGGWLAKHFGDPAVFVFGFAVIALWLGAAFGMRVPGETVERAYRVSPRLDPVTLRERLVRLRGVREAVILPGRGIARLRVYPESFDERAVREIIEGDN
jgi:MFS family permease